MIPTGIFGRLIILICHPIKWNINYFFWNRKIYKRNIFFKYFWRLFSFKNNVWNTKDSFGVGWSSSPVPQSTYKYFVININTSQKPLGKHGELCNVHITLNINDHVSCWSCEVISLSLSYTSDNFSSYFKD